MASEYYIKNKTRIDKSNKKWAEINKEKTSRIKEKWSENNPVYMMFHSMRCRCSGRKILLGFDRHSFEEWYNNQEKICKYCGISEQEWQKGIDPLTKSKYYDKLQLDRIVPEKGYVTDNVVLACPRCNRIKSNFFSYKQMLEIGKIVNENTKHTFNRTQDIPIQT